MLNQPIECNSYSLRESSCLIDTISLKNLTPNQSHYRS